jgi:hypothetical protein
LGPDLPELPQASTSNNGATAKRDLKPRW